MKNRKVIAGAAALALVAVGAFTVQGMTANRAAVREPDVTEMIAEDESAEAGGLEDLEDQLPPLSDAPGQGPALTVEEQYIQEVIERVNAERTAAGLNALETSDMLNEACAVRAKEVAGTFSHTRPDGTNFRTAVDQCGGDSSFCGENVGSGYRSPQAVTDGWMKSKGHKENILLQGYTHIGAGYYQSSGGRKFWTLIMAKLDG